jgi:hypothetical protein
VFLLCALRVSAQAGGASIVMVQPGEALERAARTALEPWGVKIVVVSGPNPGASAPRAIEVAQAMTAKQEVSAVIWLSEHEQRVALWIYDAASNQVIARPISSLPPFDEPVAAAIALSIKTLLRYSATAPAAERFGAQSPDTGSVAPPVESGDATVTQDASREPEHRAVTNAAGPGDLPKYRHYEFEVSGGMRFLRTRPADYEPRLGLGLTWWPSVSWLGIRLAGETGPGVAVSGASFQGRLVETQVLLSARLRGTLTEAWQVTLSLGGGVQLGLLDGSLLPEVQPTREVRVDPVLAIELQADWVISAWVRLGVRAGTSWMRSRQFSVDGQRVLALTGETLDARLVLGVSIP